MAAGTVLKAEEGSGSLGTGDPAAADCNGGSAVAEQDRVQVMLEAATTLLERLGGKAPLAMLSLDPKVLEFARELMAKNEGGGKISLQKLLEDAIAGAGQGAGLRIVLNKPLNLVVLAKRPSPASPGGSLQNRAQLSRREASKSRDAPSRSVRMNEEASPCREDDNESSKQVKRRSASARSRSSSRDGKRYKDAAANGSGTRTFGGNPSRASPPSYRRSQEYRDRSRSTDADRATEDYGWDTDRWNNDWSSSWGNWRDGRNGSNSSKSNSSWGWRSSWGSDEKSKGIREEAYRERDVRSVKQEGKGSAESRGSDKQSLKFPIREYKPASGNTGSKDCRREKPGARDEAGRHGKGSGTRSSRAPAKGSKLVVEGVELQVVLGVPFISIGKGTDFDSNAAWLLQISLGDQKKAESLLEPCDHENEARTVVQTAMKQKIVKVKNDIGIVRQRDRKYPPCLAGGLQGKRSMMLALTLALCSKHRECYDRCMGELKALGLQDKFRRLMSACNHLMQEVQL